jgi:hypothetical protein
MPLPRSVPQSRTRAEAIRFSLDALARDAVSGGSRGEPTLDEMLTRRLDALPPESRAFLEALAGLRAPDAAGACLRGVRIPRRRAPAGRAPSVGPPGTEQPLG